MKKPIFTGAGVAIVTPFIDDNNVNYEEFGKIIDHQIENGTDAIIVMGTTGESPTCPEDEHERVVDFCCKHVAGRVPVIAGAGSNDTKTAVKLTKSAKASGADAVLSVTPYYNKTTQAGLIAHFTSIADCEIPVILYNVPSRTGISFTANTYKELSKHPYINGVKEASGNFSLLAEAMALCSDDMNFWSGNDDQIVPLMSMGGKGVISVLSNVAPKAVHDICQHCFDGNYDKAAKMQLDYLSLANSLFCEVNPIPVKKAMELLGWNVGPLRLPLVNPTDEHTELIRSNLKKMNCKI